MAQIPTKLVPIGNSMGVRLPKTMIEQARLANCELVLRVTDEGILIAPKYSPRKGWKKTFKKMHKNNDKPLLPDVANDFDDKDWQW